MFSISHFHSLKQTEFSYHLNKVLLQIGLAYRVEKNSKNKNIEIICIESMFGLKEGWIFIVFCS